jgi:soluble lytic murein transglycosylase-like protein
MTPAILTALFLTTSMQFDLPQGLLNSLCMVESGHNINAVHKNDGQGNSVGLCQIKLKTSRWLGFKGTEKQLMDPKTNIYYAAKYLAKNRTRYNGNLTKAIIAYNIGNAKGLTSTKYSAKVLSQWRMNNVRQPTAISCIEKRY